MDSVSGKTFPTINPVTEEKICDVAEGDKVSTDIQNIMQWMQDMLFLMQTLDFKARMFVLRLI